MSNLPKEVQDAGYSISKSYPYPAKNTVNFGKFGDVCMEKLTLKRAQKLVKNGFKHLTFQDSGKAVAAFAKTDDAKQSVKGK